MVFDARKNDLESDLIRYDKYGDNWVSVDERLPDKDGRYRCIEDIEGQLFVREYIFSNPYQFYDEGKPYFHEWNEDGEEIIATGIIAWMDEEKGEF